MTPRSIQRLERLAHVLDGLFRIPRTRVRVGLDPLLGVIPGGDVVTALFALAIVAHALWHRVPPVIVGRMAINVAMDYAVSFVPLLGDFADIFVRANHRNIELLRAHAGGRLRPRTRDYFIVAGAIAIVLLPVVLGAWMTYHMVVFTMRSL